MEFRPCIDIHNGKVKQIVGSTLKDQGDRAEENFVSEKGAGEYAALFREDGLPGGHVILLNPKDSPFYEATAGAAREALRAYPGGLMVGGGITDENAAGWLSAGASHVIVTSWVFKDGKIKLERLKSLIGKVGKERIVLDFSCRKRNGAYYICTDRWQKFTDTVLDRELLSVFSAFADEFLVHGIDVEGRGAGFDRELIAILKAFALENETPVTYAGGIRDLASLAALDEAGGGRIHATIGSALDIYGGTFSYREAVRYCSVKNRKIL
ncbi:MAG: phosphoribosylformimino-5-aminoimidazole carboxamide ribotide isomerase [Lachnospiraceae bacterium]|nr:phosphoribosylformimino-5-aminoimidazole carboxamide ribotide isomerase [Lachnospiraceae bacterium]